MKRYPIKYCSIPFQKILARRQGHIQRLPLLEENMLREHYKNYPNSSYLETLCPLVTFFWSKTILVVWHTQEKVLGGPGRYSLLIWLHRVGQSIQHLTTGKCVAADTLGGPGDLHPLVLPPLGTLIKTPGGAQLFKTMKMIIQSQNSETPSPVS